MKALTNSISRLIAVLNRMRLEVVGHGGDGPRDDLGLVERQLDVLDPRVEPDLVRLEVGDHPPGPAEEAVDPLDPLHAPGLDRFERPHEHLVEPKAVGAIFLDDSSGLMTFPRLFDIL